VCGPITAAEFATYAMNVRLSPTHCCHPPILTTVYIVQALLIFERKIFRRIYGPKYEHGEWKSRTNRELEEMSKGENIVK